MRMEVAKYIVDADVSLDAHLAAPCLCTTEPTSVAIVLQDQHLPSPAGIHRHLAGMVGHLIAIWLTKSPVCLLKTIGLHESGWTAHRDER